MVYTCELYIENLLKPTFILIQAGIPCKWAPDSQRFLLESFDLISNSPSHIYHSALPLSPPSSWLHKCYTAQFLQEARVVGGLPAEWGTCSRAITLSKTPLGIACWKDILAIGSVEVSHILILSTITGSQISVFSGHTGWVMSLAFSFSGTLLVSGGYDATAKLWDVQTGGVIKTFYSHTGPVSCVSLSLDCTTLAFGCMDSTIHLCSVSTGECFHVIDWHKDRVNSVDFSPMDSQCLISASKDCTIQKWDISGCQIGPTYEGDGVAFSSDGTHFVSWKGQTAAVQDSRSGVVVTKLQISNDETFLQCCFSPGGEFLAGSADNTIYIWDISCSDPHLFKTLSGHTASITSLAFSSSLISASIDSSVRFWQISSSPADPVATETISAPPASASIMSVSLQPKNGIAISSDSAGVLKTWDIFTGLCKASFQTPAPHYSWRDAKLIEGKLIFVWRAEEEKLHIWDAEKSELLQTVDTPELGGLRISGDGSKVFCLTTASIQAWSMWTGEAVGEVEIWGDVATLDPLWVDGSRVWVCFDGASMETIESGTLGTLTEGWDFGILGASPVPLSNTFPDRPRLDLVNANGWEAGPAVIKDTITGKDIFQLVGRYERPPRIQWDGQYLVAGYASGELLILDFNHVVLQ